MLKFKKCKVTRADTNDVVHPPVGFAENTGHAIATLFLSCVHAS